MKKLALILILLLVPAGGFPWSETLDLESGEIDNGTDSFTYAGTTTSASTTVVHSGTYSAKIHFTEGDSCWDTTLTCGDIFGITDDGSRPGEGDELWVRGYYYFASSWSWLDQTEGGDSYRKVLRFTLDGTSNGNIGIGAYQDGTIDTGEVEVNSEVTGYVYPAETSMRYTGTYFPTDEWVCIEQYVKLSTSYATAKHIVWRNGIKVWDLHEDAGGEYPTMADSSDEITQVLFFTYWNQNVDQDQDAYIDDVVITDTTPSNQDAEGNYMIGPTNWGSPASRMRIVIGVGGISIGGNPISIGPH